MRRLTSVLVCVQAGLLSAPGEIHTETVTYSDGDTDLIGYFAVDTGDPDTRPGAIVVHEWWGHDAYAQQRARMLAEQGYAALALDMYGDGQVADHPSEAGAFAARIGKNFPLAEKRFRAAMKVLTDRKNADPERIVALGYCFGGSTVLNMARRGLPLQAVASVHGGLDAGIPIGPESMSARILVCHGEADTLIPMEQVHTFKQEMEAAGADYTVKVYPDAGHSFSNPEADRLAAKFQIPVGYHPEADKASWADILTFFAETLKQD